MKKLSILLGFLVVIGFGLFFYPGKRFVGEKINTEDVYSLQFEQMNQEDMEYKDFQEGEEVSVSFLIQKGKVNLWIGKDEKALYKGDNLDQGEFVLVIPEKGSYMIRVEGKKAQGFIEITNRN